MKYRKKPVVVDAWQFLEKDPKNVTPHNLTVDLPEWLIGRNFHLAICDGKVEWATITTLEGVMRAEIGDWIIKGVKGEIYPCKPDIFASTYEQVFE